MNRAVREALAAAIKACEAAEAEVEGLRILAVQAPWDETGRYDASVDAGGCIRGALAILRASQRRRR